ncbi:MAG: ParB N-terminal domain-containing protein [Clostridia bacterium]|nr:ParB N-terminal domain-containing protein [Clostridia bacterium]
MAKSFGSFMDKKIAGIAKASNEKANLPVFKLISSSDIIDYPNNKEDMGYTADIENAIKEIGFTDPLEVTPSGAKKYMILSGHRRRLAGVNAGMDTFPCIVRHFDDDDANAVENYVLLANSQRDSSKDPLLYCRRYKMHEAYLTNSGFGGSKREEIAKRLGISTQQADRYNQFNKIIDPVWDLVRAERVGMSSVLPMSSLPPDEQGAVYSIIKKVLENEERVNREKCELIIKGYKDGKEPDEIALAAGNNLLTAAPPYATAPGANDDGAGRADLEGMSNPGMPEGPGSELPEGPGSELPEDVAGLPEGADPGLPEGDAGQTGTRQGAEVLTKEEIQRWRGLSICKNLKKLHASISKGYEFPDDEIAKVTVASMSEVIPLMFSEIRELSRRYNASRVFDDLKAEMEQLLEQP